MRDSSKTKNKLIDMLAELRELFTELEESETKRKLAEESFRLVVESSPNAIVMVDQDGKIKLMNCHMEEIFGYYRRELIGQTIEILVPKRFRDKHSEDKTTYFSNPQARPMGRGRDLLALHKNGSEFPVEIGLSHFKTKEVLMVIGSIVDISQRKNAENELKKDKEKTQKYLDVAEVMLVAINDKEEVTMINKKGCKLLGYDEENIIGKNWFDSFLPVDARTETRVTFRNLMTGKIESVEYHENNILTKRGEERVIAWHNTVLTDKTGNIIGALSSGVEILHPCCSGSKCLKKTFQELRII